MVARLLENSGVYKEEISTEMEHSIQKVYCILDGSGKIAQRLTLPKFPQKCAHPSREKKVFSIFLETICILSSLLNFTGNMKPFGEENTVLTVSNNVFTCNFQIKYKQNQLLVADSHCEKDLYMYSTKTWKSTTYCK